MARLLRTFVALRLGTATCRRLRQVSERLATLDRSFRPPRTDDFHLTLQFLGNTREADVSALGSALVAAARTTAPLTIRYGPLGAFPSPARARAIWVGARDDDGGGALEKLAAEVGRHLEPLGYPPEARRYTPHITIGRLRHRPFPALVEAVEAGADLDLGAETLSDVKLILSDPGERGYHYIDLTSVELGGGADA